MIAIEPFPFIIGRDEDCNLKLTDKRFSRHHLEIRNSGDHLWIRDFKSTNGTFVNQKATTDTNEMSRLRNALGRLNIDLAFDDFGVGQTRLVELARAPPDFLKFDESLIRQIHLAPKRLHQMVSTFVKAAQDLGIATVAEGIECSDEAETCQRLGFNFAQGFFYGRPLSINEIN
jgi:EAL domain-containing protein (putative c-di-GMP-specific phosphodiesterase class I)